MTRSNGMELPMRAEGAGSGSQDCEGGPQEDCLMPWRRGGELQHKWLIPMLSNLCFI